MRGRDGSEDKRTFGPYAVESRSEAMTAMMRAAIDAADHERGVWPLAGRALISGEQVVLDRIRPGEPGMLLPLLLGYTPEEWRADPTLWARCLHEDVGHQAGDELIRTVARTLAGRLRASDAIARLGGDEFACLLRGADAAVADAVACELIATLRGLRVELGEKTPQVTASAGIAEAIVALARAAGRRTVAEFVADQETLELLAELGVDLAQGFHVGRPRPLAGL